MISSQKLTINHLFLANEGEEISVMGDDSHERSYIFLIIYGIICFSL